MLNISVTLVRLALNVAIFDLTLAWGVDSIQPSIDSLIQWDHVWSVWRPQNGHRRMISVP